MNVTLTKQRLDEVIECDAATGEMRWRVSGKKAGCKRKDGYLVVRIDRVLYFSHRLMWMHVHGYMPLMVIDHLNGVRDDNRIENIRDVSASINLQNQRKSRKNTSSSLLGVQKNHGGWQALIWFDKKRYCLGTFKTPEEAHKRYLEKKREIHMGCTI